MANSAERVKVGAGANQVTKQMIEGSYNIWTKLKLDSFLAPLQEASREV